MKLGRLILASLITAAMTEAPAAAEEAVRIGLLVANNRGSEARPSLRYAEQDAGELGQVLVHLGGFRPEHVHIVQGRSLRDVGSVLQTITKELVAVRAGGRRAVLLFYFSGHSDGQALELGSDHWQFADVRRQLQETGADIRIAIIDSCKSGALLAEKGGAPGPTFDIRFTDDLATSGEAVLTSSAAHEMALESREIRASFFSHHLVSGLRGAADASGDGRVTLGEAYRYAFVNTLLATSNTLNGPQHPGYDYRLTGQGELVLTDLLARGAKVALPRGFDRILIADTNRRHLVAELTNLSAHLVALPAGRYLVQGRKGGRAHLASVDLREGESRELSLREFIPSDGTTALIKGDEPVVVTAAAEPPARKIDLSLAAGVGVTRGGASQLLPWVGTLRLESRFMFASGRGHGLALRLDLASNRTSGFRESAGYLGLGYFASLRRGRLAGHAGWRVVGGPIVQDVDDGPRLWVVAVGTGPWLAGSVEIVRRMALGAAVGLDGMLMRRDGAVVTSLWPSAAVTVEVKL